MHVHVYLLLLSALLSSSCSKEVSNLHAGPCPIGTCLVGSAAFGAVGSCLSFKLTEAAICRDPTTTLCTATAFNTVCTLKGAAGLCLAVTSATAPDQCSKSMLSRCLMNMCLAIFVSVWDALHLAVASTTNIPQDCKGIEVCMECACKGGESRMWVGPISRMPSWWSVIVSTVVFS